MVATVRRYEDPDYQRIGDFLVQTYSTGGGHVNWTQPRWEYMHYHPGIQRVELDRIGVCEANQQIVGVVHPEHSPGTAYFEIDPDYGTLKRAMITYAEEHLSIKEGGLHRLNIYINNDDGEFQAVASEMRYVRGDVSDPMSQLPIPAPDPEIALPPGFRIRSLAEDNDLGKLARVAWRGFNHGDGTPDDDHLNQELLQSAPNFREDLWVVVEAPNGEFASNCGVWYEPTHSIAYVEPVATDPDYRRMGLGRAAVLEGIRRCGEMGATMAWVGATMPFYLSMGFRKAYGSSMWQRKWS